MKLSAQLEEHRIRDGELGSPPGGLGGAFEIPGPCGERLLIVADPGDEHSAPLGRGWEHVSVSTKRRTPNWTEMCLVKNLCWEPEDCVIQYHPPASRYVNRAAYVLHLWKRRGREWPQPPMMLVG